MLTGSKDKAIEKFRLHQLSTYGLLAGLQPGPGGEMDSGIDRPWLFETGAYAAGREELQGPPPHPQGQEIMKKRETVPLSLPPSKEKTEERPVAKESEKGLFEELRRLRLELARKEGLPPYCIFHDRTLWEMAGKRPTTQREMMAIVGVGEITFKKYGRSFLDLISSLQTTMRR